MDEERQIDPAVSDYMRDLALRRAEKLVHKRVVEIAASGGKALWRGTTKAQRRRIMRRRAKVRAANQAKDAK